MNERNAESPDSTVQSEQVEHFYSLTNDVLSQHTPVLSTPIDDVRPGDVWDCVKGHMFYVLSVNKNSVDIASLKFSHNSISYRISRKEFKEYRRKLMYRYVSDSVFSYEELRDCRCQCGTQLTLGCPKCCGCEERMSYSA